MLGKSLLRLGRREEALALLHRALQCNARDGDAWHGLGQAALAEGRVSDAVEALTHGLQNDAQLVGCYSDLGVALGRAGRWSEAVQYQFSALRLQANGEELLNQMGGRPPVLDGMPRLVVFECRLGHALNGRGEPRGAAAAYRDASQRCPEWPDLFAARAWTLITEPDPNRRDAQEAYELASQAVEGVGEPPAQLLHVLAAAEAARGDFTAATKTAQRALNRASADGDLTLANTVREHLRLFEQRRPVAGSGPELRAADRS
jgi:tetratricopeptide (TPR) repeat protein